MSESKEEIKFAFPFSFQEAPDGLCYDIRFRPGMTLKEYAAIHLKVPLSGTPWLDEMIEASRRDDFAKAILPLMSAGSAFSINTSLAYNIADALIKAAEEGMGEK